jgi:hypothetical protein
VRSSIYECIPYFNVNTQKSRGPAYAAFVRGIIANRNFTYHPPRTRGSIRTIPDWFYTSHGTSGDPKERV